MKLTYIGVAIVIAVVISAPYWTLLAVGVASGLMLYETYNEKP